MPRPAQRGRRRTCSPERCERAIDLASGKCSVYWCNLNEESALLAELDPDAVEIKGGMSIDKKEDVLMAFANGDIQRLITKAKMTSMGLNWQHCNHTVYFPTWSYEQWYQALRRFWRFGQQREVQVHLIVAEGEEAIARVIDRKADDHATMKVAMRAAMLRANERSVTRKTSYQPKHKAGVPAWAA